MRHAVEIPTGERGVVRVFRADMSGDQAAAFNRQNGTWPLRDALGAADLQRDKLAFFPVSDLTGLGLAGYLHEGQGVATEQIDPIRDWLNALTGHVLVLPSSALGDQAQVLHVGAPLSLVATLAEDRPPVVFEDLPSAGADGGLAPPAAVSARIPGRWLAMLIALFLALIIITVTMVRP